MANFGMNARQATCIAVLLAGAVALGGCTRGNPFGQTSALGGFNQPAQPLNPAPLPPVDGSALPPADGSVMLGPDGQPVNNLNAQAGLAASGMPVNKNQALGNWQAQSASTNCVAFLTLTRWGSGNRGGTRGCGASSLSMLDSWDVKDNRVVLYDRNGTQLGTLFRTSGSRFDGMLSDGQPVSLSRS